MAESKFANQPTSSGEGQVLTYTIYPTGGGDPVKVFRGFRNLNIYESIFDTTVRAESEIVDAGAKEVNIIDRLKLTTGNKVEIVLEDGYKNKLKTTLRLKEYNYEQDTKAVCVRLSMWSKESIDNEDTLRIVIKKYTGLISDSVTDIITNTLGTSLPVDVDTSLGEFIFTGNKSTDTPFDKVLWLASRTVPDMQGAKGVLAGYLFYQTTEAFKFKSVDKLFGQSPKAKFIFNEFIEKELPPGYDAKIITFKFNKSMDIENFMHGGTFSQIDHIGFNPRGTEYNENRFDSLSQNMKTNNAGKDVPEFPEDLNFNERAFHLSGKVYDTGEFMKNPKAWNAESTKQNYPVEEVMRQAKSRYNQLHTSTLKITIPLNFKLHAGDMIECDFPEVSDKKTKVLTKRKSGLYMIEELVHNISLVATTNGAPSNLTTLSLIRDTEGKK